MGIHGPIHPDYVERKKESPLIKELMRLPRHFKLIPAGIELGCSWVDMSIAACLLARTAYWGNTPREVISCIIGQEYPPAKLGGVVRKISPDGRVFVSYIIHGNTETLRTQRWYYNNGMLYVTHPRERNKALQELVNHYVLAKERALKLKGTIHGEQRASAV